MQSIKHIEDLSYQEFIEVISNLNNYTITEKIDGVNATIGIDKNNNFYLSRELKNGQRFYSLIEYEQKASNNAIMAAHHAFINKNVIEIIKEVLKPEDHIEIEILFGKKPNAIIYGSNKIVFIRMINGSEEKIRILTNKLQYVESIIEFLPIVSTNGKNFSKNKSQFIFTFTDVPKIDNLVFTSTDINDIIKEYKNNIQLETNKKIIREIETKFKLSIKQRYLDNFLNKMVSLLSNNYNNEIGIEGIVLRHNNINEQIKIVNKDKFSIINRFNHSVINKLKNTSRIIYTFDIIDFGFNNDIFNNMLKEISILLNLPKLSHWCSIKRGLKTYGTRKSEIIENLIKIINNIDEKELKLEITNIINKSITLLNNTLKIYNKEWKNYTLQLKTGEIIKFDEFTNSRTLTAFAEIRLELLNLLNYINNESKNYKMNLIESLYGKQLKTIG